MAERKPQEFSLDATFGLELEDENGQSVTITGYTEPHPTTPKLDPEYIPDPHNLFHTMVCLLQQKPVCIQGPSGTGKTALVKWIAAKLNWAVRIISSSEETEATDLIGTRVPDADGSLPFMPGPLLNGYEGNECDLVIWDEITKMRSGVLSKFNGLFEGDPFTVDLDGGRMAFPAPTFKLVATANSGGGGDLTGHYGAENVMDGATRFRFRWLYQGYPDADREIEILAPIFGYVSGDESLMDDETKEANEAVMNQTKKFVQFMNQCRHAGIDGEFGIRQSKDIADNSMCIGELPEAILVGIVNALDDREARQTVVSNYAACFGERPDVLERAMNSNPA